MDHIPGNALRVFYVGGYRVKQVPALDLSSVTNGRQIRWNTWTYSITRYFSPGKSKTSSNWMMLGWSIAVRMEISLSIMCSFPWHFACIKQNKIIIVKRCDVKAKQIFWVNSSFQLSKKPASHSKQLIRQKWVINSSAETTLQMSKSKKSGHCTII